MLGQCYRLLFEAKVDVIGRLAPFNQKGHKQATLSCHSVAVIISPPLPPVCGVTLELQQGRDCFHRLLPKSEGMERMLLQINHCDQSHGCTASQWSVSLWKSSPVPDVPANDYVVSDAKGKLNIKEFAATACQFLAPVQLVRFTRIRVRSANSALFIRWCLRNKTASLDSVLSAQKVSWGGHTLVYFRIENISLEIPSSSC